jgi:hypothetical protein
MAELGQGEDALQGFVCHQVINILQLAAETIRDIRAQLAHFCNDRGSTCVKTQSTGLPDIASSCFQLLFEKLVAKHGRKQGGSTTADSHDPKSACESGKEAVESSEASAVAASFNMRVEQLRIHLYNKEHTFQKAKERCAESILKQMETLCCSEDPFANFFDLHSPQVELGEGSWAKVRLGRVNDELCGYGLDVAVKQFYNTAETFELGFSEEVSFNIEVASLKALANNGFLPRKVAGLWQKDEENLNAEATAGLEDCSIQSAIIQPLFVDRKQKRIVYEKMKADLVSVMLNQVEDAGTMAQSICENFIFHLQKILELLKCLHQKRLAYGDLKGENLLIDHERNLKFGDLRSIRNFSDPREMLTYSVCPLKCVLPENIKTRFSGRQFQGTRHVFNGATDMYALGVFVLEFWTRLSWPDLPLKREQVYHARLAKLERDMSHQQSGLDVGKRQFIYDLVKNLLAADPCLRWSAEEALAQLNRLLKGIQ